MKKLSLLKSMLAVVLAALSINSNAQALNYVDPTLLVNLPAPVAGVKNFTKTNDGTTATGNWGRAIDSTWWMVPLVKTLDTLANGTPTQPLNSLVGKFAMVYRGTNQFGEKALNAQTAGAMGIIIVNNVPGGPVGMAAGNVGAQVTIPVLMISLADGDAINSQMNNGQNVFISLSRWGFGFNHDLGFVGNSVPLFAGCGIPMHDLATNSTSSALNAYTGCFLANFGSSTETNIKLKSNATFVPTSGSSIVLHSDSIEVSSAFPTLDSIIEIFNNISYHLPPINSTGKINFNFSVSSDIPDDQPANNIASYSVDVTDTVYSKCRLNASGDPIATVAYRFNNGNNQTWGPLFYVNNGGYEAKGSKFTLSADNTTPTLAGQVANLYLFEWNDQNNDSLFQVGELTMVGAAGKQFTAADSNYKIFYAKYSNALNPGNPIILKSNHYYWVAAEIVGTLFLGCDGDLNYYTRSYAASKMNPYVHDFWSPQISSDFNSANQTDNLNHFPFVANTSTVIDSAGFKNAKGLVPAITLSTSLTVGINEVVNNFNPLTIYPNPTQNELNVKYAPVGNKTISVRVMDGLGRIIYRQPNDFSTGIAKIDTRTLPAGSYYLIVQESDGKLFTQKFVINK